MVGLRTYIIYHLISTFLCYCYNLAAREFQEEYRKRSISGGKLKLRISLR